MDPPTQGVPSAGSRASTQESLLSGLQPDCPGERHQVVLTSKLSLAVQSPVWLRGGGGSLQGSGLQPPRADLSPQALGQPVGSGRPLGPLASVLPCHKLQAGCFVLGKPQLDPRGMRVSLSTRTQPCQRTPRPSAPLPPLPSPPGPGDHPVVGGGGRTTAPVHPPGSTCCLLSTKKCASRCPWAAEQSLQPTVKAIPVVKLP